MAKYDYDIVIIGGGSGGLTAARIAAALGARTALVDKQKLGGDCLNYGCVPSKSMIHVAKVVTSAREAYQIGLGSAELAVDMGKVSQYIQDVINRVSEGEDVYTEGVEIIFGKVQFRSPHELEIDGQRVISSQSFLIATGSRPTVPSIEGLKEAGFWTNEDVFDLTKLPPTLTIIGGGPIGVELGQSFARLGSKVTIVQGPERILPKEDPQVSEVVAERLVADGVRIISGTRLQKVRSENGQKIIEAKRGYETVTVESDELLLALGRTPNCESLNLEAAGVEFDPRKGIKVDDLLQTTASNIYAIGDVIGGYLFTHVAAYQAGVAVRNCLLPVGKKKVDYRVVPWVTFTDPEAARVGLTEEEARKQYKEIRVINFPWHLIDRAQAEGQTAGFIKLILEGKGDTILGAHIVGENAGELLPELALAMQHKIGLNDVMNTIHAYPTLSVGIQNAAFEAYLESSALQSSRKALKPILNLRG
jgi:dihydrolipoamide dehydrogenase